MLSKRAIALTCAAAFTALPAAAQTTFNFHRGDTLASLDRFKKTAANLKATVITQHDARDVSKLPVLPTFAK